MGKKIGILTFPICEAGNIPLSNLVDVLKPLSNDLYLITGNDGYTFFKNDPRVHTQGVMHKCGRNSLTRSLRYIYTQLKISYKIAKMSKFINVWIFFIGGDTLLLPMLTAKLRKTKVILASAGSSLQCSNRKDANLSIIIRFLENINRCLSNQNVLYSKNIIKEWRLEKYAHKISIGHEHILNFNKFKVFKDFKERRNLVGYIGAFSEEKGILEFLNAIYKILEAKEDVEFLIGGNGRLQGVTEKFLNDECLKSSVKYVGWISHDEIPICLNQLKLLVLPSYTEGLPNIILEAMACGTPVLATPVGAIPDFIKDSETGFLMENNSPECIAENVVRALNSPDLEDIAEAGRRFVEGNFTFEKAVESWKYILQYIE